MRPVSESMSATVFSDPTMLISSPPQDPHQPLSSSSQITEAEMVTCECCGLSEECTPIYIETIRRRFLGKWICGLCSEAIKYETNRRIITTEEAIARHMNTCYKFKSSCPPSDSTVHLISAMRQILKRSLDSPRGGLRSAPGTPIKDSDDESGVVGGSMIVRSESCFATLTG